MIRMDLDTYLSTIEKPKDFADRISVPRPLLSQWRHGRSVPEVRCIDIERATKGAVTCEELRPDLADRWAYLRGTEKRVA